MKYLTVCLLILLPVSQFDILAAEHVNTQWTQQSVEAELESFELVLKELGLKAPMKRARDLAAQQ